MADPTGATLPVVGVDGGQSQTRLRLASSPQVIELPGISRLESDPDATLVALLARAWADHDLPGGVRLVLGLTTLPPDAATRERLAVQLAAATGAAQVWLTDDRITAHQAGLGGRPGVCLTAGTGVACTALSATGQVRFLDGHGYLLGDEGAGFWIGRAGLAAVLHHRDGYGPATALTALARNRFGDPRDLPEVVHTHPRAVDAVARFAVEVLAAAADGDPVAAAILDDAAARLARTVTAAVRWVAAGNRSGRGGSVVPSPREPGRVPVVLGGRLLDGGGLRARVEATLFAADPGTPPTYPELTPASGTPLDGAVQLGSGSSPGCYAELVHTWSAARNGEQTR